MSHSHRFPSLLVALVLGAVAPMLTAPVGGAAAVQTVPVPQEAWIWTDGHGYGHGRGMSQHGAQGAALRGLGAWQIVDFYYPGTRHGTSTGQVKVLITADTSRDGVVSPRSGLQVRDLATGRSWELPANGANRWKLYVAGDGRSAVAYRTDRWHWWRTLLGDGEFAAGGRPVTLHTPSGTVAYRGGLRGMRPAPGSSERDTVNRLSLDSYLKGVVPLEMPASWSPAAVRAQAIAARTYASFERAHPLARHYQICDTTACQVYGGYSAEHPASNAAVDATAGRILTYQGEPAFTQFSASSGGWTAKGSAPYLVAQRDPYDGWSGNPNHSWRVRLDSRTIENHWPGLGNLEAIRVTARDGNGEWGGRILQMVLDGSKRDLTITGDTFRMRLGLKSTWLNFTPQAK